MTTLLMCVTVVYLARFFRGLPGGWHVEAPCSVDASILGLHFLLSPPSLTFFTDSVWPLACIRNCYGHFRLRCVARTNSQPPRAVLQRALFTCRFTV